MSLHVHVCRHGISSLRSTRPITLSFSDRSMASVCLSNEEYEIRYETL
jgi:hypothetical protein